MSGFRFRCTECSAAYGENDVRLVCPACAKRQQPGGVTRGVLEVELEELPPTWPSAPPSHPDFLTAFLPIESAEHVPPLPVGGTPLLPVPELRRALDMPRLWLKDDTRNPSGSTKDRASLLVVTKARQYGYDTVAAASTGNAATALAAVSAAAGTRAILFVPAAAPEAKLVQMLSYGATVLPIDGNYDDAFELCLAACEEFGWYNRNTALNPFTIEGKKTAGLEIALRMVPEVPDAVLVPTGDGVILAGVAKGFADLVRSGLIDRMPRMIAVQPEGAAAIVTALKKGSETITPVSGAHSVADSLTVEAPRNALQCLRVIRASGGSGVAVPDAAILEAIPRLAGLSGVFAEPSAAAVLAGLEVAVEEGLVEQGERVVLLVTGTGLKDVGAAARVVERPGAIPPTLEAVAARI
ncbi:MAG TPA: threonine synthase [Gemmatimonadales bacterium]|nr:threonine synthase [Gemmatimonadales bacterium]